MLDIPSALKEQFEEYLLNKPIPNSSRGAYKKWLRYYLDFCRKYNFLPIRKESLPRFILKLQEKKQTKVQQAQAVKAITLYYEIFKAKGFTNKKPTPQTSSPPGYAPLKDKTPFLFMRLLPGRSLLAIPNHHQLFMVFHTPLAHLVRGILNGKTVLPERERGVKSPISSCAFF